METGAKRRGMNAVSMLLKMQKLNWYVEISESFGFDNIRSLQQYILQYTVGNLISLRNCASLWLKCGLALLYPIALRMDKTIEFGHSECNRVKAPGADKSIARTPGTSFKSGRASTISSSTPCRTSKRKFQTIEIRGDLQ